MKEGADFLAMNKVDRTSPKDALAELAGTLGCPKKDLLAMAPNNDPFNSGTENDWVLAEWFAAVWKRSSNGQKCHIRKIHYRVVSAELPTLLPDGETQYVNTDEHWKFIQKVAAKARYLGTVAAEDFIDRRNPDPILYAAEPNDPALPTWEVDDFYSFYVPDIDTNLSCSLSMPEISVDGYTYDDGDQPVRIEFWCEKSGENETLTFLCKKWNANLCPATGFQSITSAINLLERCRAVFVDSRPVRIFYLSDFDPAGKQMPVQVSRQLEFWTLQLRIIGDIKLTPLLLTAEQVRQYKLPRIPIKDTDVRKESFEDIYGEGAVELDALEAIHPGALEEIVDAAVAPYRDETLAERMSDADYKASVDATQAWTTANLDISRALSDVEHEINMVFADFEPELQELKDRMETRLKPHRERVEILGDEAQDVVDGVDIHIELPPRPVAEIDFPEESDWLFDSSRSYGEQLGHYHKHKNGDS